MSENIENIYWKLFKSMFVISMSTFGGGFVIITLMQKKFCDELGWIEKEEILDLTALAQSAPGSLAVNASILFGYQLKGIKGSLVAMLATILPPLLIISTISIFYSLFSQNQIVRIALKVMRSGVAAVILDAALTLMKGVIKSKDMFNIMVMVFAFIFSYFIQVDAIMLICLGLLLAFAIEIIKYRNTRIKHGTI
ncbi:MAG: chromate transporter [Erysipelotrichaceae bacterium]|nr:chromate transporter [Erysipelotrichaceae bacterium]